MNLRTLSAVAMLGLSGLAVTGCGTSTIDTANAEKLIASGLEEQTDAKGVKVDCPDDVEAKTGGTFDCTATDGESSKVTILVTQKDDKGNVKWEIKGQ